MYELTINDTVYSFKFGFGWYRDINKSVKAKADSNGFVQEVGIKYKLAALMDHDPVALLDILDIGNKYADAPRATRAQLEAFIEDDSTPYDDIVEDLLDFFSMNHTTKSTMEGLRALMALPEETKASLVNS